MTAVAEETDLSALFDWSLPCDKNYTSGLCPETAHDAHVVVKTTCRGCQHLVVSPVCYEFRAMLEAYLETAGVECRHCQSLFTHEDFIWEPLR